MPGPLEVARVKLVTIIVPSELRDRVQGDLKTLGASGCTLSNVTGRGLHGVRKASFFDTGNVKIETLVVQEVAERILERIKGQYAEFDTLAYAYDVEAVPREHFV